jgi:hypothetical protein
MVARQEGTRGTRAMGVDEGEQALQVGRVLEAGHVLGEGDVVHGSHRLPGCGNLEIKTSR